MSFDAVAAVENEGRVAAVALPPLRVAEVEPVVVAGVAHPVEEAAVAVVNVENEAAAVVDASESALSGFPQLW